MALWFTIQVPGASPVAVYLDSDPETSTSWHGQLPIVNLADGGKEIGGPMRPGPARGALCVQGMRLDRAYSPRGYVILLPKDGKELEYAEDPALREAETAAALDESAEMFGLPKRGDGATPAPIRIVEVLRSIPETLPMPELPKVEEEFRTVLEQPEYKTAASCLPADGDVFVLVTGGVTTGSAARLLGRAVAQAADEVKKAFPASEVLTSPYGELEEAIGLLLTKKGADPILVAPRARAEEIVTLSRKRGVPVFLY